MASAPDLMKIISILHRTREVSAGSRHRAVLAVGSTDQQARTIAKTKDLSSIRFQLTDTSGYDGIAAQVGSLRWDQVAQDGINKGDGGCQESAAQQHLNKPSAGYRR